MGLFWSVADSLLINQFLNRSIKLPREGENTPVTNWFAPIPPRPYSQNKVERRGYQCWTQSINSSTCPVCLVTTNSSQLYRLLLTRRLGLQEIHLHVSYGYSEVFYLKRIDLKSHLKYWLNCSQNNNTNVYIGLQALTRALNRVLFSLWGTENARQPIDLFIYLRLFRYSGLLKFICFILVVRLMTKMCMWPNKAL